MVDFETTKQQIEQMHNRLTEVHDPDFFPDTRRIIEQSFTLRLVKLDELTAYQMYFYKTVANSKKLIFLYAKIQRLYAHKIYDETLTNAIERYMAIYKEYEEDFINHLLTPIRDIVQRYNMYMIEVYREQDIKREKERKEADTQNKKRRYRMQDNTECIYFKEEHLENKRSLNKRYRILCKTMHPDAGGNKNDFITLTREYEMLKSQIS